MPQYMTDQEAGLWEIEMINADRNLVAITSHDGAILGYAEIKWRRHGHGLAAEANGKTAIVGATQFGTFTSTKRYQWEILSGIGERIYVGTEYSQKKAKEEALAHLSKTVK